MVATVRNGVLQPLPRGRVVGGSSAVNGTLFTRGLPEDFDRWSAEGNEAWSYERVLPYFKKLENDHDVRDEYHGTTGPVPVRRAAPAEWAPIDLAFAAACRDAGYPDDPDMNGPASIGVGALPVNNVKGIRMNTALAYLDPLENRPNLTVRGDAPVLRVLLEAGRAIGVEVMLGGQVCAIHGGRGRPECWRGEVAATVDVVGYRPPRRAAPDRGARWCTSFRWSAAGSRTTALPSCASGSRSAGTQCRTRR